MYLILPPKGYKLLTGWFDWQLQVKRKDLVFNLEIKQWRYPKVIRYRRLGIVRDYWCVAREIIHAP